jgi:hypothetical protein
MEGRTWIRRLGLKVGLLKLLATRISFIIFVVHTQLVEHISNILTVYDTIAISVHDLESIP